MSVDPAADPNLAAPPAVDPARPAATETTTPTPGDSAVAPDTTHPAEATAPQGERYGLGAHLDPAQPSDPAAGDGEGGYVSSKPLLMIGAAGPDVAELAWLLAGHGYANAITEGKATFPPTLDDALMAQVIEFQQDNGIDPWQGEEGGTNPPLLRRDHSGVVDARTWEALLGYKPTVLHQGQPEAQAS